MGGYVGSWYVELCGSDMVMLMESSEPYTNVSFENHQPLMLQKRSDTLIDSKVKVVYIRV
jgi:hypothetical protein